VIAATIPFRRVFVLAWWLLILVTIQVQRGFAQNAPGVVKKEFIYQEAPFPECHASTITELADGSLIAAWFGGTEEKDPDVGIWFSRFDGSRWSAVREVANGVQAQGNRFPCWNPVLFTLPDGTVQLFYKVGPSPRDWWGMITTTSDAGKSWSTPRRLPAGILGPIKNKPVLLSNGALLSGSSTENDHWRVHLELSLDLGQTWTKTASLGDVEKFEVIQPTILNHGKGLLQILCRSKQDVIVQATSRNGGITWSELSATKLPNPNSGIDAVTLADGRFLLVYNHTTSARSPINVAISEDGENWFAAAVLENSPGEFSYPAVIQSSDGLIHVTYTWKRRKIRHVAIDLKKLKLEPISVWN